MDGSRVRLRHCPPLLELPSNVFWLSFAGLVVLSVGVVWLTSGAFAAWYLAPLGVLVFKLALFTVPCGLAVEKSRPLPSELRQLVPATAA